MRKMLNDLSKEEVCAIIDDSLSDYCCRIAQSGKKPMGLEEKISWVKTFPTFWSNFIFKADFDSDSLDEQVKKVAARMKAGELPDEWVIGPNTRPANLCEYLTSHGFTKLYEMIGMAVDLLKLGSKAHIPRDVDIKIVDTSGLLKLWAGIVSNGLFNGNIIEYGLFKSLLGDNNSRFYLAFLNDKPVASSMLQLSNDAASIDMVATLPEYRGMGIGTAMTTTPLLDARELGYTIGVLQASEAGEPVYRKIGFEEYCKFHVCKLT